MLSRKLWRIVLIIIGFLVSGSLQAGGSLLTYDINDASSHIEMKRQNSQIPVRWNLSSDGLPGSGLTNLELQSILQVAFDSWEGLPGSNIQFIYAGEIDAREVGVDGINLITFTDHSYIFPPGVLAVANTYSFAVETTISDLNNDLDGDGVQDLDNGVYPAGSIYEADIVFNSSYDFVNTGVNGSIDLQAVALHEIGHSFGLSHSIIGGAVMHPFLSQDILSARMLKADDIAFASALYPKEPFFSSNYGSISGLISNGLNSQRILGAHVYALDPASGQKTVGAYSLLRGDFLIPGLQPGNYYVGIEPLDNDPIEADPSRINSIIEHTFDTRFAEEFFDDNESNIETDALNAEVVSVVAGANRADINIITNTVEVPGVSLLLQPGINLFAYPVETADGFMSFDLLTAIGSEVEINSIDRYNSKTGRYERTTWVDGKPSGENYAIERGNAYLVHMQQQKVVTFKGSQNCPTVDVSLGFNLIGVACPPAGYSAYDLLDSISTTRRVMRFNQDTAAFEIASFDQNNVHQGVDFPIRNGEGYVVETLASENDILLPGLDQLFPPFISGVSPGRAIIGSTVLILGQGFSDNAIANEVSFNGVRAAVSYSSGDTLTVTVPSTATSGPLTVSINGRSSNSVEFIVEPSVLSEVEVAGKDIIDGQVVKGNLDTEGEQDRYTFIATKGAMVSMRAESVIPGVPDLILALEGPYGNILASDDNSGGGSNPNISRFEILQTGRYTAVITQIAGSGVGSYTFNLNIENVSSLPEINFLSGDFQTALMGTMFSEPLEILVTGSSGAPVAGSVVTFVTDDVLQVSNGFTANSAQVVTSGNGIARVSIAAPNEPGQYEITVQVPGFDPKTIHVSSMQRLPTFVEKTGSPQNCGGEGCPVNELLPTPYSLRFLDADSQPLEGVLVKFVVASGDGKLKGSSSIESARYVDISGKDGVVEVTHRLGKTLLDEVTKQPLPQVVAAVVSIPNSPGSILFQSSAKSGDPASITARTGDSIRLTMKTVDLNAFFIEVKDEFDNPVAKANINATASGNLEVLPGDIGGVTLPGMMTNELGQFVGAIRADNVLPTKDEFGNNTDTSAYNVTVSVAGAGTKVFRVDVDMGPVLVNQGGYYIEIPGGIDIVKPGAKSGAAQWVGKSMDLPVVRAFHRLSRVPDCKNHPGSSWQNTAWNLDNITDDVHQGNNYSGLSVLFSVMRDDNGSQDGNTVSPTSVGFDRFGQVLTNLTMGKARGSISVLSKIKETKLKLYKGYYCGGEDLKYLKYDSEVVVGEVAINRTPTIMSFRVESPRIEVTMSEFDPGNPDPDPMPGRTPYSGLDLASIVIELNGNNIFNGPDPGVLELNKYPNFMEATFDGLSFGTLNNGVIGPLSPGEFKFVYYPKASELQDDNSLKIKGLKDKTGNFELDGTSEMIYEQTFTLP